MINTGTANTIRNHVKTNVSVQPRVKLTAEFNNNRFSNPKVKLNATIFDDSMNEDSISEINRPESEIRYGICGYAKATSQYSTTARYRVSGTDMPYQYIRSNVIGAANNNVFDVQLTHDISPANVLYAKFNTHGGTIRPSSVEVYVREGQNWVSAGQFSPNSAGQIMLYRQANGTWSGTKFLTNDYLVTGIRVVVRGAAATGFVELVELATKYVTDLSSHVTSFSFSKQKDEPTIINPFGVGQAGSMTVTLDDTSNMFAQTRLGQYRRYAERDAKFLIETGYRINGLDYYIAQPEFWADSWNFDSNAGTVDIQCTDRSRWLQRAVVSDNVYKDCPVAFIVQEIIEAAGISGIDFRLSSLDGPERLPWVWYRDGESLWDSLNELAKALNGSFFYESDGDLVWVSKSKDYEQSTPVYKFSSQKDGTSLPNMFSLERQFEEIFNSVKISYEQLDPNQNALGEPTRQSLWQASDALFVRSSDLLDEITSTVAYPAPTVRIDAEEMKTWPFEGKFQIEGEVFSYKGKHNAGGAVLNTPEDVAASGPADGRFANVKRAIDGTAPDAHLFGSIPGGRQHTAEGGQIYAGGPPWTAQLKNGRMSVKQQAGRNSYSLFPSYNIYLTLTRGVNIDSYDVYGTEIIFPASGRGRKENIAGMVLHKKASSGAEAYYFELATDDYVVNSRKGAIGNLRCYKTTEQAPGNGSSAAMALYGPQNFRNVGLPTKTEDPTGAGLIGYTTSIEYDRPYRLEVHVGKNISGQQTFYVYLDGNFMTKFTDTEYTQGLWGTFVRGDTEAEFEMFYAYENDADGRYITDEKKISSYVAASKLYNRVTGDYTYTGPELAQSGRVGKFRWFFEEYQPVVHERKEFEVEHSVAPAFNFWLFNSNPVGAFLHNVGHTPFKTRFIIDNASRKNEYLNGTDGAGNNYTVQLLGQPMARLDSQEVTVKHQASIREHGLNELEFSNPWIQTEERALVQAEFIRDRWAKPLDVVKVDVMYDPTLELGDLVDVSHVERQVYGKSYFITAIDVGWDEGFTCGLTLRRNPLYY